MSRPDPRKYLPLYLVTDTALCGEHTVANVAAAAVSGGATCVQVRDKAASGRELLELLRAVAAALDGTVPVLIDDRVDVYLAARAAGDRVSGVHIGQSDLPAGLVRKLVGPDAVVGLSAGTAADIRTAADLPAGMVDYLGVGPVHATATKPDHPQPLGIEGFAGLTAVSPLPCVAIGGIKHDDVGALRGAGAAGVAVVSALCSAKEPQTAATEFVRRWQQ